MAMAYPDTSYSDSSPKTEKFPVKTSYKFGFREFERLQRIIQKTGLEVKLKKISEKQAIFFVSHDEFQREVDAMKTARDFFSKLNKHKLKQGPI